MVDFAEHRKALLCNDAASIADYSSAMDQATKAVAAWLQNDKMYTAYATTWGVPQKSTVSTERRARIGTYYEGGPGY